MKYIISAPLVLREKKLEIIILYLFYYASFRLSRVEYSMGARTTTKKPTRSFMFLLKLLLFYLSGLCFLWTQALSSKFVVSWDWQIGAHSKCVTNEEKLALFCKCEESIMNVVCEKELHAIFFNI